MRQGREFNGGNQELTGVLTTLAAEKSAAMAAKHPVNESAGKAIEARLEAVVKTLATAEAHGEGLPALAHDARNMVTALGLYCELLEKPGVLSASCRHYGSELRLLAAASRRLVEKLVALDTERCAAGASQSELLTRGSTEQGSAKESTVDGRTAQEGRDWNSQAAKGSSSFLYTPAEPIANLAVELRANRNLLAALAGPTIQLRMVTTGGELPVRLTGEDLTRILVNLVKNSAEAMPGGGEIQIALSEEPQLQLSAESVKQPAMVRLTMTDNGPGIGVEMLEAVFAAGFTTRSETDPDSNWPGQHRGLGLSITRSILESAGGAVRAFKAPEGGAGFEIRLPVDSMMWTPQKRTQAQRQGDGCNA